MQLSRLQFTTRTILSRLAKPQAVQFYASTRNTPKSTTHSKQDPWVKLKYFTSQPSIFPSMIHSQEATTGDLVTVYDKGKQHKTESDLDELVHKAIKLRLENINTESISCYRVINAEGDNLSGFVVDKYGEFLSISVYSVGVYQRLERWLPILHKHLHTKYEIVQHDVKRTPPFVPQRLYATDKKSVTVTEYNDIKFQVNFETGHKTGFFCDQRENRKRIMSMAKGKRVIDLCCYTGGFAIYAAKGGAKEVTGVDLDEDAIKQAKINSNLNSVPIQWVHEDSFAYARNMKRQNKTFDIVILDPPKFITGTTPENADEGKKKYYDLNQVALSLVANGGYFVTCSCSGRLSMNEFEDIVIRAAHKQDIHLQILDKTGAGFDHPVMSNFMEGTYLKVIWTRVLKSSK